MSAGVIRLTGIEVFARHGALAVERRRGQTFVVDLVIELDLSAAGESDDLADTVDYGMLAVKVHDLVAGERWNLIERVAARVAEMVLEFEAVQAVEVTVHKPQAPIPVPFEDVSVTIRR